MPPDCITVPLANGMAVLIDAADVDLVLPYHWTATRWKHTYYAVRFVKEDGRQRTILMHREIMCAPTGTMIDHRNGNGLDNRRTVNLRFATPTQNNANARRRNNRSGYKGVSWHRANGMWHTRAKKNGREYCGGYYRDPIDAARAYDRLARRLFGEFTRPNFPDEG